MDDVPTMSMRPILGRSIIDDIQVMKCGHLPKKCDRLTHRFSFSVAALVLSGRGTWQCDDGPVHTITAGTMFMLWPGPVFRFGPEAGTDWDEWHLCLNGNGLDRWQRYGLLPRENRVWPLRGTGPLTTLFRRIAHITARGQPGDADRAVATSQQLLIESVHLRAGEGESPTDPIVSATITLCRDEMTNDLDFHQVAHQLGISYSLLRKRVREVTGSPPQRLLAHLRCERARHLLATTDLPVQEVGERCGIEDPYQFSRLFKRHVGLAPSTYRRHMAPFG